MGLYLPAHLAQAIGARDSARLLPNHAPETPSQIDWDNPLVRDLKFSALVGPSGLQEHVSRNLEWTTAHSAKKPEYVPTPYGPAIKTTGASGHSSFSLGKSKTLGGVNGFTTLVVFDLSAMADWGAAACWSVNGGTNRIEVSKDDTDKLYVNLQNEWSLPWTIDFPLNKLSVAVGTHDGTNAAVHLYNADGYQSESFASASSVTNAINKLTIGASTGSLSARHSTGMVYMADIHEGVLPDEKIKRLLYDAYQYYREANQQPYVLVDPIPSVKYLGRSSGSGNCSTNTTTFSPAIPAWVRPEMCMLFSGHIDGGRTIVSDPTSQGWTAIEASGHTPRYWKIYQNGDADPILELDGGEKGLCYISVFEGTHQTAPVDVEDRLPGSGTTCTCPDVTTTVDQCAILRGYRSDGSDNSGAVQPADTILAYNNQCGTTAGPTGGGLAIGHKITAGAVGTADWTNTSDASHVGWTIALRPPDAPAGGINASLSMGRNAAVTPSVSGTFGAQTNLSASRGITPTVQSIEGAAVTLSAQRALTAVKAASLAASANFQSTRAVDQDADTNILGSLDLSRNSGVSVTPIVSFNATLSLSKALALTVAGNLSGISGSLSLTRAAAASQDASFTSISGSLTLARSSGLSSASIAQMFAAVAIGRSTSIAIVGGSELQAALTLSLQKALSQVGDTGILCQLDLTRSSNITTSVQSDLVADVALSRQAQLQLIANAIMGVGLSLDCVKSIVFSGSVAGEVIIVEDDRVIVIEFDGRTILM